MEIALQYLTWKLTCITMWLFFKYYHVAICITTFVVKKHY
jgi:hypothetical protein